MAPLIIRKCSFQSNHKSKDNFIKRIFAKNEKF